MAGFRHRKPHGTFVSPMDSGSMCRGVTPQPGSICAESKQSYKQADSSEKVCRCTGLEKTSITGLKPIASYTGDFPSPLQYMWYVPDANEQGKTFWPDSEIRGWIKDAAAYHGIPHLLLAIILQQENAPGAPKWKQVGQFAERSLTTFFAILDEQLWDVVPDKLSGGSTGFANMSRATLLDAVKYTQEMYGKPLMPHDVQYRRNGWNQDTRISGDDWKADLYYASAHLRQLIDVSTKTPCHSGALNLEQLQDVIRRYNGSGPLAEKYAKDAMSTLKNAEAGKQDLYFYEK